MKEKEDNNGCLYIAVATLAFWGTVITLFFMYF